MPKKMGRPRKEIDRNNFEKLCAMMCTQEEIAGFFNCHIDTINNWCKREYGETFSDTFKRLSASGKISLRRTQWRHAERNVTMAIWLGKQYLGQRDRHSVEHQDLGKVETLLRELENIEPIDE